MVWAVRGRIDVSGLWRNSLRGAVGWLIVAGWLVTLPAATAVESQKTSTPNVIVIFMDDI